MTSKEQALKHLDELEARVDILAKGSDALERRATELAHEVEVEKDRADRLLAERNDLQRKLNGYGDLAKALGKIRAEAQVDPEQVRAMVKEELAVGSNPTRGGTVKTTLVDVKHVVHVPVKEEEVTIDTGTNRGKILRLAAKGFFQDWKRAGEVSAELEKRGQAMNDKVVMMELANLCNLGYLGRTKRENQFVYKVPDEGVVFKSD